MKLEKVVETADFFKDLLSLHNETTLAISDLERFLYMYDGMNIGVKAGDPIKPGSATASCIENREAATLIFDSESSPYQKDYTTMTSPIFGEDGSLVGTVTWTMTTNQVKLAKMSEDLYGLSEELAARAEGFSSATEALSEANHEMNGLIEKLVSQMSVIGQINSLIADLSSKSKILGLNATIEAVRAGDFGKSFSVVAKEIEKLSSESAKSAKEVSDNLEITRQQIQDIFDRSKNLDQHYQEQAKGSMQMAASVQQVNAAATALRELSAMA